MNNNLKPSEWIKHYCSKYHQKTNVLDLACGTGRHSIYLLKLGFKVTAIDKNIDHISFIKHKNFTVLNYDLEKEKKNWPFNNKKFGIIIVTNYLYRSIFYNIINSLNIKGLLLYETFSIGNEKYGKPRNLDYLLKDRELLKVFNDLDLIAFENVDIKNQKYYCMQRIAAIKN